MIREALAPSLEARTDDNGQLVDGIYVLSVVATPELECNYEGVANLAYVQGDVLFTISDWSLQNQHNAKANLNVLAGDFIGACIGVAGLGGGGGRLCADDYWPIVQIALMLNHTQAPQLALDTTEVGVRVSCANLTGSGLQMIAYPRRDGPHSLNAVRVQSDWAGQLDLVRDLFPAGIHFDDVRVDCTTPEGMTSGLAIPPSDLPGEGCPYPVGVFIAAKQGNELGEIDVMGHACVLLQIPDAATFDRMKHTWRTPVFPLDPADFNNLARGPLIRDYATHPHDFMMAIEDLFGAPCSSFRLTSNLNIGALVQNAGQDAIYVLAGGWARRPMPDLGHLFGATHAVCLLSSPCPRTRGCRVYGIVYGMKRTTLYLPDDLKRALEHAASARGCSEAELVREAIRALTTEAVPCPRLPLFRSAKPTLAEKVDAALVGFGRR